jgi:hypothetical protein
MEDPPVPNIEADIQTLTLSYLLEVGYSCGPLGASERDEENRGARRERMRLLRVSKVGLADA